MVKKNVQEPEGVETEFDATSVPPGAEEGDPGAEAGFVPDTEFDLEDEYKPEPLVPKGNFRGNVVGVAFEPLQNCIAWKVCLADNGGMMSDGETPIDGSHHYVRNWMPRPDDEKKMTKDGRQTKRQSKINMMKRFAENMKINMNTAKIIAEAIRDQDWIGISVIITITIGEWEGRIRNEASKMIAAVEVEAEE